MSISRTFEPFVARLGRFIRACPTPGPVPPVDPAATSNDTFEVLARELFSLQYRHNLPYARICDHLGRTPERMTAWQDLPFVPTQAFKDLELSSLTPENRTQVFHSSGTTEQRPSRHFHSCESLAVYELSLLTWFRAHLAPDAPAPPQLFLTPPPQEAPHSSLIYMFNTLRREVASAESAFFGSSDASGAWGMDHRSLQTALTDACVHRQPIWLLGTAFSFVHLLDALQAADLRFTLPDGSRILETGGYKGRSRSLPKEELHALIEQRLGVPADRVVCEYGMSELSSQAYDWPLPASAGSQRQFRFPPWARCRVLSPETGLEVEDGEIGLLQILDLANVFSVMAIQTEDLVRRSGEGFQWVGRASAAESRGCSLMSTAS